MRGRILLAAAVIGTVVTAAPSPAFANPYTYAVCGSGYSLVSGGVMDVRTPGGALYAQMYVTWNGRAGMNCVVAIKRAFEGTGTEMTVVVQPDNDEASVDHGSFSYYGGPVYGIARNKCISASTTMWNPAHTIRAQVSKHGWCS